jgi:hypothetical protein
MTAVLLTPPPRFGWNRFEIARQSGAEAIHWRRGYLRADLPDTSLAMRDASIDDRHHTRVSHQSGIDARGHSTEIERRQRE